MKTAERLPASPGAAEWKAEGEDGQRVVRQRGPVQRLRLNRGRRRPPPLQPGVDSGDGSGEGRGGRGGRGGGRGRLHGLQLGESRPPAIRRRLLQLLVSPRPVREAREAVLGQAAGSVAGLGVGCRGEEEGEGEEGGAVPVVEAAAESEPPPEEVVAVGEDEAVEVEGGRGVEGEEDVGAGEADAGKGAERVGEGGGVRVEAAQVDDGGGGVVGVGGVGEGVDEEGVVGRSGGEWRGGGGGGGRGVGGGRAGGRERRVGREETITGRREGRGGD